MSQYTLDVTSSDKETNQWWSVYTECLHSKPERREEKQWQGLRNNKVWTDKSGVALPI